MPTPPLILVVDDDPDILTAIGDILENEGYRVARARHGKEALERVRQERPNLILLDLMMPVMDGAGFIQALRAETPHGDVPVVIITADGNPNRAVPLQARGIRAMELSSADPSDAWLPLLDRGGRPR